MDWKKYNPPAEAIDVLENCPSVKIVSSTAELLEMACGGDSCSFDVEYEVPGKGSVVEATVSRVRNGLSVNYPDVYMRRRDPDCMLMGDDMPSDKESFFGRYGRDFHEVRDETFAWLKTQELAMFGFLAGERGMGLDVLAIAPANAAFFALGLAMLQGITPYEEISPDFNPRAVIYVAPVFRHTHFEGRQVVVHHRLDGMHELFSYNL